MGSDGFQTQRTGSLIRGRERAEKVLADAISIDGRKEWTCKFCLESNVWTRWRCRRCNTNIPAGLRGKYRKATAARTGEWSTGSSTSSGEEDTKSGHVEAENKELRARLEALEKKVKEPKAGARPSIKERKRPGRSVECGDGPRCYTNIPAGLRGKYRQAVAARTGEWSTGSSTSSGEVDGKSKSLEAENKELRAKS